MKKICKFTLDKLVRDRTIDRLCNKNIIVHACTLTKNEYIACLKDKIIEEAHEVHEIKTREELINELADVLEVIHALAKAHDIDFAVVEQKRCTRKDERGGFEEKVYIDTIQMDAESPHAEYYRMHVEKYPEVD